MNRLRKKKDTFITKSHIIDTNSASRSDAEELTEPCLGEFSSQNLEMLSPLFSIRGNQMADAFSHQTGKEISSQLRNLTNKAFGDYKKSLSLPCCFFKYDLNQNDFIGLELSLFLVKRISQFFKGIDSFPELSLDKINLSQSDVILLTGAINQAFSKLLSTYRFNGEVSDVILVPDKMVFCPSEEKIMIAEYDFSLFGANHEVQESHGLNLVISASSVSKLLSKDI